jgi:hypothetical protein
MLMYGLLANGAIYGDPVAALLGQRKKKKSGR